MYLFVFHSNILGNDGPVRSISKTPTLNPLLTNVNATCVVTEDFPTPPLPDKIKIICLTCSMDLGLPVIIPTTCQ